MKLKGLVLSMIERLAFQLGVLGRSPNKLTPLPLAERLDTCI